MICNHIYPLNLPPDPKNKHGSQSTRHWLNMSCLAQVTKCSRTVKTDCGALSCSSEQSTILRTLLVNTSLSFVNTSPTLLLTLRPRRNKLPRETDKRCVDSLCMFK